MANVTIGQGQPVAPPLLLSIDTNMPVRARDAGRIFEQLPISFELHRKDVRELAKIDLRISGVRVGSLGADFMAFAGTVVTLYEFRDVLISFVTHLSRAHEILQGLRKGRVSASDRKTIEAMASPVANDNARQVCLQVFGDNATILVISPDSIERMRARAGARPARLRVEEPRVAKARPTKLIDQLRPRSKGVVAVQQELTRRRSQGEGRAGLAAKVVRGRLQWLDGKWYVRIDGTESLLALHEASRAQGLPRDRAYAVTGSVITKKGVPAGFDVASISDNL